jgi:predicted O-methyltransferase YrrM
MTRVAQDHSEFAKFCEMMRAEKARSYLEIGSWKGGSLWLAAKALQRGSRIVSVDKIAHPKLQLALRELKNLGYDTRLILGDSIDEKTIAAARALGPYDCVFIDGDHRLTHVTSDWENYGPMGRIVGFHDIARDMPADRWGGPHQVSTFWKQFDKSKFRHEEIISDVTRARTDNKAVYGIGVIWKSISQEAST